jgi:uncharacterized membrane protein (DUF4010 family)
MLMGFLGGLVSSTSIYVTLPRLVHDRPGLWEQASATALLATAASLTEFLLIIAFVSPQMTGLLLWPVISAAMTGIIIAFFLIRKNGTIALEPQHANPLDLKAVLRISSYIAGMIIIIAVANRYLGVTGVQFLSFLGGMFELHSTALGTVTLFSAAKVTAAVTELALLLAVSGSFLAKISILWSLGRDRFALVTTLGLLLMYATGAAVYVLENWK